MNGAEWVGCIYRADAAKELKRYDRPIVAKNENRRAWTCLDVLGRAWTRH